MKNLIAKSQSLFLVAILAIFPSANAMSPEDSKSIGDKIQKMYDHIKMRRGQMQEEINALRDQVNAVQGGAANNNSTQAIKDISDNLDKINTKLTEDIKLLNNRLTAFETQQSKKDEINLNLSNFDVPINAVRAPAPARVPAPVRAQFQPISFAPPAQVQQNFVGGDMVNELQAAGTITVDQLNDLINKYIQDYEKANPTQRGTLTKEFKKKNGNLKLLGEIKKINVGEIERLNSKGSFGEPVLNTIKDLINKAN